MFGRKKKPQPAHRTPAPSRSGRNGPGFDDFYDPPFPTRSPPGSSRNDSGTCRHDHDDSNGGDNGGGDCGGD